MFNERYIENGLYAKFQIHQNVADKTRFLSIRIKNKNEYFYTHIFIQCIELEIMDGMIFRSMRFQNSFVLFHFHHETVNQVCVRFRVAEMNGTFFQKSPVVFRVKSETE